MEKELSPFLFKENYLKIREPRLAPSRFQIFHLGPSNQGCLVQLAPAAVPPISARCTVLPWTRNNMEVNFRAWSSWCNIVSQQTPREWETRETMGFVQVSNWLVLRCSRVLKCLFESQWNPPGQTHPAFGQTHSVCRAHELSQRISKSALAGACSGANLANWL